MVVKVVVSRLEDFPDGDRKIIDVNGRSVGVFRFGNTFYAIRNRCPHQWGPLCTGKVRARATATVPGDFHMAVDEVPLIACPWHGWEYDLKTGQSWLGPGYVDARTYEIEIESGRALVDEGVAVSDPPDGVEEHAELRGPGGRLPGPYKADTVPVYVEDNYVVIDD
jgi:nitrite reductase/ring-hydroxylating ferredoxin subunit